MVSGLGDVDLGLGEHLLLWALIAVSILGFVFATGTGGALVFILMGAVALILVYALLVRLWRFLMYGSLTAGNGTGNSGGGDTE